jgi:hypothetical protein
MAIGQRQAKWFANGFSKVGHLQTDRLQGHRQDFLLANAKWKDPWPHASTPPHVPGPIPYLIGIIEGYHPDPKN